MSIATNLGGRVCGSTLAAGLLVGAGMDWLFFDARHENLYGNAIEWAAIIVPLGMGFAIPGIPLPGWEWFGITKASRHPLPAILWLLTGIVLAWVLACLTAQSAGEWYTRWWAHGHRAGVPGLHLWEVWILTFFGTWYVVRFMAILVVLRVDGWLAATYRRPTIR